MGLKEQLDIDLKEAMRSKDEARLIAIRMLKAAVSNLEFTRTDPRNPQHNQPVTDGDLARVVDNQIKQRRESIELFQKGNRKDLVEKEQAEINALLKYMPPQLTRVEIREQIEQLVAELGTREFPKVMKEAAARLKGRADGKLVNEVVRELTG
jgi:uncharacterized protein YqeY